MSTTTPNAAWARRRNDRRAARRTYTAKERYLNAILTDLHEVERPAERAGLLTTVAGLVREMADLHTAGFGLDLIHEEYGQPMGASLRFSGQLWDLAAWTERDLAAAQWTPVEDLSAGQQVWFASRFVPVAKVEHLPASAFSVPIQVTLAYGDGDTETLDFEAGETVRTGGPAELEIAGMIQAAGIEGDEAALWQRLATTYDRYVRRDLLYRLADAAEPRVGATAADALLVLAGTEEELSRPVGGYDPAREQAREDARVTTSVRLLLVWALALLVWTTWGDSQSEPSQVALWGGFFLTLAARFGAVPLLPGNRWQR